MGQRWVFTPFTMASALQIFQSPSCQGAFLYNEGTRTKRTKRGTPGIIICDGWSRGSSLRVPRTCGITLPSPDRQSLPRCALALAAMFSPSALHFKRRVNGEVSSSVSHRWLCSSEVARGEPENSSSYSISTRLSQTLLAGRDVIPCERI